MLVAKWRTSPLRATVNRKPPPFSLRLNCLHLFFTPWQGSAVPLDRLDYGYACLSEGNRQTQTDEPGIIMVSVMFSSHSVVICLPSNSASTPQTPALFHLAITETWQPGALETRPLRVTAKMTLGAVWQNHSRTLIRGSTATRLETHTHTQTHTRLIREYYLTPSVSPIPHFFLADKCASVYLGYPALVSICGLMLLPRPVCVFIYLENNLATLRIIKVNEDWACRTPKWGNKHHKNSPKEVCIKTVLALCVELNWFTDCPLF